MQRDVKSAVRRRSQKTGIPIGLFARLAWIVAGILWALVQASASHAAEVRDLVGRMVRVPDNPRRVVALAPSLTEIVFAVGAQDRLVGVTAFSDFPLEAKDLPKVGSYVHLDLERIVALKPDLCLAIKDGNPREAVQRLERLGIPVFAVNPTNLNGVMETVKALGRLLHAQGRAHRVVESMDRRIRRIRRKVSKTSYRPRVFFQIGIAPIVSVGTRTFAHELITLAGGINVAEGPEPYPRFSVEQVLGLKPDVILISSMARGEVFEKVKKDWLRWRGIPAVTHGRVFLVDSNLFDRPTPRLVDGLELLAKLLHPEVFHGTP